MNLKGIMLSEMRGSQKDTHCVLPLTFVKYNYGEEQVGLVVTSS